MDFRIADTFTDSLARLTGALLDCLTHRVHILEGNGQSYRLQDAKGRLKRKSVKRTFDRRRVRAGG